MIYLSGPMSGIPDHNRLAFRGAANLLRALGHTVLSPAEFPNDGKSWEECLRLDILFLLQCDHIVLLSGWEGSRGANLELRIAQNLGMEVSLYDGVAGTRKF